jgi:aminopeptidase N
MYFRPAAFLTALSFAMLAPGSGAAQRSAAPSHPALDVLDYAITLDLPDTGATIEGRAVLTVRRSAPADTLTLDLIALRVDSVLVNERAVTFARDSGTIGVPLPAGSGDTLAVTVRYGGAPSDGLIIRTDSLGRWTAFGDNFAERARYWIPSVDVPSDKATVTWIVRAPAGRRVVANGELQEETPLPSLTGAPRTLTKWRESRPIPTYTMVIAAAPLAYYDLGRAACGRSELGGCVRQSVYVEPELVDFLPGPFAHSTAIVDFFSALVAPFPYERLAHVQSLTRFGGMENATEIFYADKSFRDRSLHVGTVAHETAHQWFGDAVTEERFADLWLSEGFATYWAALWTEHAEGDSAFRAELANMREEIIKSPVTAQRPVRDTTETDHLALLNTNSYQKGAWALHMLRGLLGDSAFFRGVRAYYLAHRHGNARTEDLRQALERSSGRALGWFFDQWLEHPGFPELTTRWRYDGRSHRVTLYVEQGSRFAPFRFPLTVEVRDALGRSRRTTVEVAAERSQRIVLPLSFDAAPRTVIFDPHVQLLATFTAR